MHVNEELLLEYKIEMLILKGAVSEAAKYALWLVYA
jgi:hypothetical protein